MTIQRATHWQNWSGSFSATPKFAQPQNIFELQGLVRQNKTIRVAGASHSFNGLVQTDDLLISLEQMKGITDIDEDRCQSTVQGGVRVYQILEKS